MFVNSLLPYGTPAIWVIPLFGQAVNNKALHFLVVLGWVLIRWTLAILLLLKWKLQASTVLSLLSELKNVFLLALRCCSVWPGATLWLFMALGWGGDGSAGFQ